MALANALVAPATVLPIERPKSALDHCRPVRHCG
jgi:hypothetical protein